MTFFPSLSLPRLEDLESLSPGAGCISTLISLDLVGESGGIECSKNQVFAGQKRQSVHQEGNNALSSRRRNAISCDPSVGDKVELVLFNHVPWCCPLGDFN